MHQNEDGTLERLIPIDSDIHRRQDLPEVFAFNGAVYVARTDWFSETKTFFGPGTVGYVMPPERSADIDAEIDLKYVEFLIETQKESTMEPEEENLMKIFLGDLVHDWEKVSLWTVPLNVGYIGAYAQKYFPGELEVRLFKRPNEMIEAIKKEQPDVVGLAYYVWNANLNNAVLERTGEYAIRAEGGRRAELHIGQCQSACRHAVFR